MIKYSRFIALLLVLLPVCAGAVKVPGLFAVEVPVADQSDENRPAAVKTALGLVLVKLTGDRYALGRTALAPVLARPERYVQQYRYREEATADPDAQLPGPVQYKLWVSFDEQTLEQTLRDLGVPVWGRDRPTTLLWLVVEDEAGRSLLSPDNGSGYISVIDKRVQARGLALIYPLLDLEDTARIRASDIRGGFDQPVIEASNRYHPDSVLTGSIESPVPGIWEGQWTAYLGGQTMSWVTRGDLPDMVLDEGIDGMGDILAVHFASSSLVDVKASVAITVADVFNVDQYAQVLKYLGSLNSVTDVQVAHVEPGEVTFAVTAHGGIPAITQAIALGRRLQPIGSYYGSTYRLLP